MQHLMSWLCSTEKFDGMMFSVPAIIFIMCAFSTSEAFATSRRVFDSSETLRTECETIFRIYNESGEDALSFPDQELYVKCLILQKSHSPQTKQRPQNNGHLTTRQHHFHMKNQY